MFDHRATHFQLVALAVNESNEASTHRGKNSIQLFFLDFYSGSMIVTFFSNLLAAVDENDLQIATTFDD